MNFPFNFFVAAFAGAFLTTLIALPFWRKWCLRTGHVDDPRDRKNYDAPKIHEHVTPLAGGFAVLTGILLPLLMGVVLLKLGFVHIASTNAIIHGIDRRALELGALALGAILITFIGWWDDKHELKPIPKLIGQFIVALLVASACKRITLFVPSEIFSYAVTILWVLTVINAFNFMDNMNGLCAGLGAIGAFFFAVIAAAQGQYLVALTGFLMFGALLGFLPSNFPKAKSFLGDAGSHLVGYLLAVMAILPHFYTKQNPKPLAVLAPLLILAIPLLDILQVSFLRTLNKKPFWIGDTNHLSHRLTRVGWSKTSAVLLLWLAAAVLGAIAVWLT